MRNATTVLQNEEAKDRAATLRNRARLSANKNLLFWYRELYRDQFKDLPNPATLSILEVGSGTSPLKLFLPKVVTSDVLDLLCLTATTLTSWILSKTKALMLLR